MNVAFAYNVKNSDPSLELENQIDTEFDSPETINAIKETLESLGHTVLMVEADENAFAKLRENKNNIDLLFNIAEGLGGDARESQIPIFCEMLGIPYTHSSPTTHAVKLDKHLAKKVVLASGIKAPQSFVVRNKSWEIPKNINYPLMVKPNKEGSSKGITNNSVVANEKELKSYVNELLESIPGEIIVEEYIDGREFTVGVIGNPLEVMPIIEQKFDFLPPDLHKIAGYELKWLYEDNLKDLTEAYDCPAKLDKKLEEEIRQTSLKICAELNVCDAARIDYRLSQAGELYFIEINTLPGINPREDEISYFPLAARKYGLNYKDMIGKIIDSACRRWNISNS